MNEIHRLVLCLSVFVACVMSPVVGTTLSYAADVKKQPSTSKTPSLKKTARLSIPLTPLPLGVARPGDTISVKIDLANDFESLVEIREVTVSCGCVQVATGIAKVLPGRSSELKVAVSAGNRSGVHEQSIAIVYSVKDQGTQEAKLLLRYEIVGNYDVVMDSHRWVIEKGVEADQSFRFTLRGFREFNLAAIQLQMHGIEVEFDRLRAKPVGHETSREVCTARLVAPEEITRPVSVSLEIAEKPINESSTTHSVTKRLVVLRKSSVSISPSLPRVTDGEFEIFVRLLNSASAVPVITLSQGDVTTEPKSVKTLNSRFYRVKFSTSALEQGPPVMVHVSNGSDEFSQALTGLDL